MRTKTKITKITIKKGGKIRFTRSRVRIVNRRKKNTHLKQDLFLMLLLIIMAIWAFDGFENKTTQAEAEAPQNAKIEATQQIKEPEEKVMEISAYSELDSCHYPTKDGCLTASGKIAEVGMVATNLYPFGTKIIIDGKEYVVEDRISTKYNNRIDIFMGYGKRSYYKAIDFGIKHLSITLETIDR